MKKKIDERQYRLVRLPDGGIECQDLDGKKAPLNTCVSIRMNDEEQRLEWKFSEMKCSIDPKVKRDLATAPKSRIQFEEPLVVEAEADALPDPPPASKRPAAKTLGIKRRKRG